jgi:hypothetical protein
MIFRTAFAILALFTFTGLAPAAQAAPPKGSQQKLADLEEEIDKLKAEVTSLQSALAGILANPALALGPYVTVESAPLAGLAGPHVLFEGANVHVRSGSGATDDGGTLTGLGNLVVGYNADVNANDLRSGSHNLVLGDDHTYTSFAGVAAGVDNALEEAYALVAGQANRASGFASSITGGLLNEASEVWASVSGGQQNHASATSSSISGGVLNVASGGSSSVAGGEQNESSESISSISGGFGNVTSGRWAWVGGGYRNVAAGYDASVSGGSLNQANGDDSSVSGGGQNQANARGASVSGGFGVIATGVHDWCAGSLTGDDC